MMFALREPAAAARILAQEAHFPRPLPRGQGGLARPFDGAVAPFVFAAFSAEMVVASEKLPNTN